MKEISINNKESKLIRKITKNHPEIFKALFKERDDNQELMLLDTPENLLKKTNYFSSTESLIRNLVLNIWNGSVDCSVREIFSFDSVTRKIILKALKKY